MDTERTGRGQPVKIRLLQGVLNGLDLHQLPGCLHIGMTYLRRVTGRQLFRQMFDGNDAFVAQDKGAFDCVFQLMYIPCYK